MKLLLQFLDVKKDPTSISPKKKERSFQTKNKRKRKIQRHQVLKYDVE